MNVLIQQLMEKAHRALETAQWIIKAEDAEGAINRAYYAAFYAATAALLKIEERPRTHSGVHNRFWECYIQAGVLPSATGKILADAFRLRQRADYDAAAIFDLQSAQDLFNDVAKFVASIEQVLED